ncbi:MAG TPA: hypothetical protein VGH19_19520 [Verrucomicrobiae bacterium]
MTLKNLLLILLLSLSTALLCGCASVSKTEIEQARFDPVPANIETLIKQDMGTRLNDPYSAVYEFGTPRRGFSQDGFAVGGKKRLGYIIPIQVNAKNLYGAYVGYADEYYLWTEGQLFFISGLKKSGMAKYIE